MLCIASGNDFALCIYPAADHQQQPSIEQPACEYFFHCTFHYGPPTFAAILEKNYNLKVTNCKGTIHIRRGEYSPTRISCANRLGKETSELMI